MLPINLAAVLIAFREGLEAALIVGIVLSYLKRIQRTDRAPAAWFGVGSAVILSGAIAFVMNRIGATLQEPYEQMFEGTTMLVAVGVLTWMIFWMRHQARTLKSELETRVQTVVSSGASLGLASLVFFAVFREGVETALFLAANAFAAEGLSTFVGSLIGLGAAALVGVGIYALAMRLNLKLFFDVTSIFLVIFAAGLFAHAVHEYQEINLLPLLTTQAWNTEWLLSNDSLLGSVLRSLVGYNANPSLLEVVGYALYWLVILLGIRWGTERLAARLASERSRL
ncbi:MAG TPA: FTR1 family protein [Anaerolineae bacterium]